MTDHEWDCYVLVEHVALLLACIRNYQRSLNPADLEQAIELALQAEPLLATVRDRLPRAM